MIETIGRSSIYKKQRIEDDPVIREQLEKIKQMEFTVLCGEFVLKLKPYRVWIVGTEANKRRAVLGLFICPDGSYVRRKVGELIGKTIYIVEELVK